MTTLPYTRALNPEDYSHPDMAPGIASLDAFEAILGWKGVSYRKDHQHRAWEYGNVLRQMRELKIDSVRPLRVLDVGSGGNYFAPYLRLTFGFDVTVEDSMGYGSIVEVVIQQCERLGITLPIVYDPLEHMPSVDDGSFDVVTCISTIEHVGVECYEAAWHEMARVTKPGGYVFVTSDYFRDQVQGDLSPFKGIQHTRYTEELVRAIPTIEPRLQFIGGIDLSYRGDWVHNYSFCNMALRRV